MSETVLWRFDLVQQYRRELAQIPSLSEEEHLLLPQQIAQGDQQAKQRFLEGHLPLVVHLALPYAVGNETLRQDLIQEGNLGLMHAIEKFDQRKGYQFSTYATYWIRQYLTRAFWAMYHITHVPAYQHEALKRLQRELRRRHQEPNLKELALELGLSHKNMQHLYQLTLPVLSLDVVVEEESDLLVGDLLVDEQEPSPEDIYLQQELISLLNAFLQTLSHREQVIWGWMLEYHCTAEELGLRFHVSARTIKKRASVLRVRLATHFSSYFKE